MRIRKNARLTGGSVPTEKLQPIVCQLNQSPWDVIPFGCHLIQSEYGEDDSFAGNANGSAGNSGGVVESVASPMDAEPKSTPNIKNEVVVHDNDDIISEEQNGIAQLDHKAKTTSCGQCKNNEAKKQRQTMNEHNNLCSMKSKKVVALSGGRRTRAQNARKAPSGTSNPYEFYYYSGFGPLWGKRRGGSRNNGGLNSNKKEVNKAKGGEDSTITEANGATIIQSPCSSSQIDTGGGFDYDDDEVEEDYGEVEETGNGESGKKRMRKPVKARSLKSLM